MQSPKAQRILEQLREKQEYSLYPSASRAWKFASAQQDTVAVIGQNQKHYKEKQSFQSQHAASQTKICQSQSIIIEQDQFPAHRKGLSDQSSRALNSSIAIAIDKISENSDKLKRKESQYPSSKSLKKLCLQSNEQSPAALNRAYPLVNRYPMVKAPQLLDIIEKQRQKTFSLQLSSNLTGRIVHHSDWQAYQSAPRTDSKKDKKRSFFSKQMIPNHRSTMELQKQSIEYGINSYEDIEQNKNQVQSYQDINKSRQVPAKQNYQQTQSRDEFALPQFKIINPKIFPIQYDFTESEKFMTALKHAPMRLRQIYLTNKNFFTGIQKIRQQKMTQKSQNDPYLFATPAAAAAELLLELNQLKKRQNSYFNLGESKGYTLEGNQKKIFLSKSKSKQRESQEQYAQNMEDKEQNLVEDQQEVQPWTEGEESSDASELLSHNLQEV